MPLAKGFLQGAQKGLDLAIPLMLQKQKIDQAESHFNINLQLKKDELLQDADIAADKITAQKFKAKVTNLISVFDELLPNNPKAAGLVLQKLKSLPGFSDLPDLASIELKGEPEKKPGVTTLTGFDAQGNLIQEVLPKTLGVTRPTSIVSKKKPVAPKAAFTPKDLLAIERGIQQPEAIENPADLQVLIDAFNKNTKKDYTYELDPGKVVSWGRDTPPSIKKVPKNMKLTADELIKKYKGK